MMGMNRFLLPLTVFFLFLLEGTVLDLIIPASWHKDVIVAPHLVLVAVLYIGVFRNRKLALLYGAVFGMLHDIVYYGPMLGPYIFGLAVCGYLAGFIHRRIHQNLIFSISVIFLGSTLFELILFGIYKVFGFVTIPLEWALVHQMLPSILVNLLFALIIYIPARKWLENLEAMESRSED